MGQSGTTIASLCDFDLCCGVSFSPCLIPADPSSYCIEVDKPWPKPDLLRAIRVPILSNWPVPIWHRRVKTEFTPARLRLRPSLQLPVRLSLINATPRQTFDPGILTPAHHPVRLHLF